MLFEHPGEIGFGSNSGFQALNLVLQFGVTRVILVGYDMNLDHGIHWHGRHPGLLNNPRIGSVAKWRAQLDAQAGLLESMGIEVLNASPISSLTAFRKVDFQEAIACLTSVSSTATTSSET